MLRASALSIPTLPSLQTRGAIQRLTLLLLAIHGSSDQILQLFLISVAVLGFALRRLIEQRWYWWALFATIGHGHLQNIYCVDNHKVLLVWWVLAVAIDVTWPDRAQLARSARWLIGGCFGFATLWKILSPDFASGQFFVWTLIADQRFESVAKVVAGIAPIDIAMNREALKSWPGQIGGVADLAYPDALLRLASAMTIWTLAIEGLLALLFLIPNKSAVFRGLAHAGLIVFILSTYSIAHVVGFGWQLAVLGIAATEEREELARFGYLGCLLIIQFFLVPWSKLLATL